MVWSLMLNMLSLKAKGKSATCNTTCLHKLSRKRWPLALGPRHHSLISMTLKTLSMIIHITRWKGRQEEEDGDSLDTNKIEGLD